MIPETNKSEEKAPETVAAENKPSVQAQIDWMEENIQAARQDIATMMTSQDEDSSDDERNSFIDQMNEQLNMFQAVKENLIAVKMWNTAEARETQHITDRNKIGILLASNIDNQIVYLDAYILSLRKDAMRDFQPWMETDMVYCINILNTLKMAKWFVKSVTDILTDLPSNQPTSINEDITELVNALKEAKEIIRLSHTVGMPEEAAQNTWTIYNGKSPEMKRLNSVLEKYIEEEVSNG